MVYQGLVSGANALWFHDDGYIVYFFHECSAHNVALLGQLVKLTDERILMSQTPDHGGAWVRRLDSYRGGMLCGGAISAPDAEFWSVNQPLISTWARNPNPYRGSIPCRGAGPASNVEFL